jgi:hypothetical protein
LRVPDTQFRRNGRGNFLLNRAFAGRLPVPVLEGRAKGLQAADIGHRIRKELSTMRQNLDEFDAHSTVRAYLDLPLMRRCLDDVVARVDPETTGNARRILLRGLGVGRFLTRLA